jgi:hypothetical protein
MFEQVDFLLNGVSVSTNSPCYAYRSYLETLLSYGHAAKSSWLTAAGWNDLDFTDAMLDPASVGEVATFMGPLHVDLMHQDRFMLPGVNFDFRLIPSRNDFCLTKAKDVGKYKVEILDVTLWLRRVKLVDRVRLSLETALMRTPAVIPFTRVEMRTFTVNAGVQSFEEPNAMIGIMPKRLVLGLVTDRARAGDTSMSPFRFLRHNVSYLSLAVGEQQIPHAAYTMDDEGSLVRAYLSLFRDTGKQYQDAGNGITYSDWKVSGSCLYVFDFAPQKSMNDCIAPTVRGNLRITIRFSAATSEALSLITYNEFDSELLIDRHRNIITSP